MFALFLIYLSIPPVFAIVAFVARRKEPVGEKRLGFHNKAAAVSIWFLTYQVLQYVLWLSGYGTAIHEFSCRYISTPPFLCEGGSQEAIGIGTLWILGFFPYLFVVGVPSFVIALQSESTAVAIAKEKKLDVR